MTRETVFDSLVELGVTLNVSDVDRAISFYCGGLGFDLIRDEESPGQDSRLATVRFGNALLDITSGAASERRRKEFSLSWTVDQVRLALDLIVEGGGRIVRHMEYGIICADPDGHSILVVQKEPDPEELSF